MGRLFGTDGVRGVANSELTCELAMKIGAAGAYVITNERHSPKILVGCDTRKSSKMLCAAISAGICSVGGDVIQVDVIPTPAMAYLVRTYGADAAVMVSASHNTMEFNGIKLFDGKGYKLSDELEDAIEAILREEKALPCPIGARVGGIVKAPLAQEDYMAFLLGTSDRRLDGWKLVLDCANGAASAIAPQVFRALGAEVEAYFHEPDGCNINDRCGSTHPQRLMQLVVEQGADAGFAFDGDADRVLAVDEKGHLVDGDRIMGLCALSLQARGKLRENTLVLTVMSNLGLKKRMREAKIHIEETAVGDRYVLENMLRHGYVLGGEQSGHVIFLEHNTTGDGMLTAIQTLNVLAQSGKTLSQLAGEIPIFPQVLINVRVENDGKQAAMEDKELCARIGEAEAGLRQNGRVLVRMSGTEPVIRVMLEGPEEEQIRALGMWIAEVLEKNHGGVVIS